MSKIIPEFYYNDMRTFFADKEFSFDKDFLNNNGCSAFVGALEKYYPKFMGKGIYKPFTQIKELREFGEELIRIQNSPLAKALK